MTVLVQVVQQMQQAAAAPEQVTFTLAQLLYLLAGGAGTFARVARSRTEATFGRRAAVEVAVGAVTGVLVGIAGESTLAAGLPVVGAVATLSPVVKACLVFLLAASGSYLFREVGRGGRRAGHAGAR